MNPYFGADFFEFFVTLGKRVVGGFSGEMASDEVQLAVLIGIAISCCLVGTFLVLKKMVMFANAISHTALLGIVIIYALFLWMFPETEWHLDGNLLFFAALITALMTALLVYIFMHAFKVQEDASIGLVFTFLFALGILAASLFTRNSHIGIEAVMGNVDLLHKDDVKRVSSIMLLDFLSICLFFRQWKAIAFDPVFASTLGISVPRFHFFLISLTAVTCMGAFRAVGVILVLAFLVAPPLIARLWTAQIERMIWIALGVGVGCALSGVALSRHILTVYGLALSTGGIVVTLLACCYLLSLTKRLYPSRLKN